MRFKRIYLELTNACNLDCEFCARRARPVTSICLINLRKVIPEIARLTSEIRPHVLGEPLLYPHFGEFIDLCKDNNCVVKITTNGTITGDAVTAHLRARCVREINFSLHSYTPCTHGSVSTYLEPILSFCGDAKTIDAGTYINLRFWNIEHGVLPNEYRDLLNTILSRYKKTGEIADPRTKSIRLGERLRIAFDSRFEWPSPGNSPVNTRGFCLGARSHIGILSDGTVVPCCLDAHGAVNIGNVFTEDLSQIIEGRRLCAIADGFSKGELVENLCGGCSYIGRFNDR
jgi:MoaA/NifB/PqqE/SkfB family radical SAM enzyme